MTTGGSDQELTAEVRALTGALCDGVITEAEAARLNEMLVASPAARRAYREAIGLHAALQFRFQVPETRAARGAAASPKDVAASPEDQKPRPWKHLFARRWRWSSPPVWLTSAVVWLAMAVVLGFLATYYYLPSPRSTPHIARPRTDDSARPRDAIATVNFSEPCQWSPNQVSWSSGAVVRAADRIELIAGLVQVEYESGVSLVVEGPAGVEFRSKDTVVLNRGKIFASVPPLGMGFRIRTGNAEIIDLGTEFGVLATDSGVSEVGVFKGKAECFALDPAGACIDRVQLSTGQATRVGDGVRPVSGVEAMSCSFERGLRLPQGICAYWRFEEAPPPVVDDLRPQHGVISDSSGQANRLDFWPGGRGGIGAYRFSSDVPPERMFQTGIKGGQRSFDCGALDAHAAGVLSSNGHHGAAEAIAAGFTVEGFFKTHGDLLDSRPMTILYQGEKFFSYLVGLNKKGPGAFSVFLYGDVAGQIQIPEVTLKQENFADGTWHYFAARYQPPVARSPGRLRVDVTDEDGRGFSPEVKVPPGFRIACSARPLLFGRQQYFLREEPKAHFNGLIDEVRIASRVLDDEELAGRLSTGP